MIDDELKQQVVQELIKKTYEDIGLAVISVEPCGHASFKCHVINEEGPKEVLVTILLCMNSLNVN